MPLLHGLLVPESYENLPQFLSADMHHFTNSLCTQLGQNIPDIAIAYNGYGAGASINHLHFQVFTMQEPLPVVKPHWQHNGGTTPYPVSCRILESPVSAWQYINELHHNNIAYKLVYLPDRIICLASPFQGSYEIPLWTKNFTWYELCGGVTTFNQDDFQQLEDERISAALSTLRLSIV